MTGEQLHPGADAPAGEVSAAADAAAGAAVESPSSGKRKKRTGAMVKDKDGKVKPRTDGRARPPKINVVKFAGEHDIWWINGGGYWMRSPADRSWMNLTEGRLDRWAQGLGLLKGTKVEPTMDVERLKMHVESCRVLDGVMNIAGYRDGVFTAPDGMRLLVKKGPALVAPVAGDWSGLRWLLETMLRRRIASADAPPGWRVHVKKDADRRAAEIWQALVREVVTPEDDGNGALVYDQTILLYTWLKLRLELLHRRMAGEDVRRNAPVLVLAGPPDSYKSFLQGRVLAPLFGNRRADPSKYLSGDTDFNPEIIGSEVPCMGDSPLGTKHDERKRLGEYFKQAIGQEDQRLHMKGVDAMGAVYPVWSFIWSINDDKNNLEQLPPMVEGVVDKFLVLHANAVVMEHETAKLNEFTAFADGVRAQLPAFVHFLLHEFEIPAALEGGRWGMVAVQAPEIMDEMFADSREGHLLDLLDCARFGEAGERVNFWHYAWSRVDGEFGTVNDAKSEWTGDSHQLKEVLTSEACSLHEEVRGMFRKGQRLDMMLARLRKEQPERVSRPGKEGDGRVKEAGVVRRLWTLRVAR